MRYILLILLNLVFVSAKRSSGGLRRIGGSSGTSYVTPNPFPERLANEINHNRFSSSPGAIAGTVAGCVVFVALSVAYMLWRRNLRLAKLKDQEATAADNATDTMPYAQRVAMEDTLAPRNPPKAAKKSWFWGV